MTVNPIPSGYHSVTPYLIIKGAAQAIEFYRKAFNASELMRLAGPDGKVGHAELQFGDSIVMLADEHLEMNALAPQTPGASGVGIHMYVNNVDEIVAQAIAAGAKVQRPIKDQFYGDRSATLEDPFGHVWTVATHVEDVTPEEIQIRVQKMMQQHAQ